MGDNPDAAENRWLRDAKTQRVAVIYFRGIAPGRYYPIIPTFIDEWDPHALKARIVFGLPDDAPVIALNLPPAKLSPAMTAYFKKCQEKLGFVPIGLNHLSHLWGAPLPDYALPGDGPQHVDVAIYVLSAVIGVAVCAAVLYLIGKRIARD